MRVACDTNVLLSAVATRGLCADVVRTVLSEHELIVGEAVLTELRRNLRTKLRLPATLIAEYESLLRDQAIVPAEAWDVRLEVLNAADARVLGEALAAQAEVFVTGDRDLLDVAPRAPIAIPSPRQFWERLARSGSNR